MSLTEDEFKAYLKTSVKEALQENHSVPTASNNSEDFLTIQQASEYTHIPLATLYDYTHKKKIPYNKVGKKLLFNKKELTDWISNHRKRTRTEIEELSIEDLLGNKRRR